MNNGKKKVLGIFTLAMINVAAVIGPNTSMATLGWSLIGWYLIGTIAFLIPLTLAGAELATGWPEGGGVYAWVREAFGEKAGFVAVFCEWSNNLVWFPTVLAVIASTFAYIFNPELANNNIFMFVTMMIVFWGTTIIALMGEKVSSRFESFGVVFGTMFLAFLIIVLSLIYESCGNSLALPPFTVSAALPDVNISTLPFIATVVLLFAGMEMAGYHALHVRDPKKDFPKAMALSCVIIFIITVIGTLAIAMVVPFNELKLAAGLMQALDTFLKAFNLSWLLAPVALLATLGGLANLATWLIGPALGLGEVASRGNMPPLFSRTNKYDAPVGVLILQALIGTIVLLIYLLLPDISAAYWFLTAMTVLLLCIVYIFVFAALIKLRYTQPGTYRAFKIPGGIFGVWIVGGLGLLACLLTFAISLIRPGICGYFSMLEYAVALLIGIMLLALPPLVFLHFKKPGWKTVQRVDNEII